MLFLSNWVFSPTIATPINLGFMKLYIWKSLSHLSSQLFRLLLLIYRTFLLQLGFFTYYTVAMGEVNPSGPVPIDSVFIYRPDKRLELWRFAFYMFLHAGWVSFSLSITLDHIRIVNMRIFILYFFHLTIQLVCVIASASLVNIRHLMDICGVSALE